MKTDLAARKPSSTQLLARVLDSPDLAEQLRNLEPAALAKLVDRVGLEDAGEIIALATTEQLEQVFDEDLWRNERPGEQERFDDARFVLWLEALLEAGDNVVAARLSGLSEDFLSLALSRRMLVIPIETLQAELEEGSDDAELAEKALSNQLSEEFDEFVVVARRADGWDSVLAALVALDRDHHALLSRLLERCAALSSSYIEDNGGLYAVLSSEEMLEGDVAAERDDRRAAAGYVAPRDAAAFLKLARTPGETPPTEHDPLTRAHFRDVERSRDARPARPPRGRPGSELLLLLQASGVVDAAPQRLLPAAAAATAATTARKPENTPAFVRAMQLLRERDAQLFSERSEELAYLANVLVAGATLGGRRVRPIEAIRAAIAISSLALETLAPGASSDQDEVLLSALCAHPADGLFRLGFAKIANRLGPGAPDLAQAVEHGILDS